MSELISFSNSISSGGYKLPSEYDLSIFKEGIKNSPSALSFLNIDKNLTEDTISHFNLGYDYYRDFITIPETKNGTIINLAYRSLDKESKTKYTKLKGAENWIFNEEGIEEAKKKGALLICSNQFDVMSSWQNGIKNVISMPVGKDAIGDWILLLENIPKIYMSFENNKTMKKFGIDFADRIGYDKCYEIILPDDIMDLSQFFKTNTKNEFNDLIRNARPFYKYTYQDLTSVLDAIMERGDTRISVDIIPFVKIDIDYLFLILGKSGAGKTTYCMNIADRLLKMEIPTMVVPYERGYRTVGERFLQIRFNKTQDEIKNIDRNEYEKIKSEVKDVPLYFSKPDIDKMRETVIMAKKLFGVRAIIIDHIEYDTNKGSGEVEKLKIVMTELKNITLDLGVMFFVVNHVKKGNSNGVVKKDLTMEDSVGGGATFRVAEGVLIVSDNKDKTYTVKLDKSNHSETGSRTYEFNGATGLIGKEVSFETPELSDSARTKLAFDSF